jgi:hypothetical protein
MYLFDGVIHFVDACYERAGMTIIRTPATRAR